MSLKTYIEFGSFIKKRKKPYQKIFGDLYDTYMLSRYFKDIFNLSLINKKNYKLKFKKLHHRKDLKFNFINFLLLFNGKTKSFYEFGQTLYERIFFMKAYSIILKKKVNLNIIWAGNDISKMFNFFCNNFLKNYRIKVTKKLNIKLLKNSTFFAKGVSLLYEKKNISILKTIFKEAKCGSFDFTVCEKKNVKYLNTGYKLYYPSKNDFLNTIPKKKDFKILFKNLKKSKKCLYFEVIFGEKKSISKLTGFINFFKKKYIKNKFLVKNFNLNMKFHDLDSFRKLITSVK